MYEPRISNPIQTENEYSLALDLRYCQGYSQAHQDILIIAKESASIQPYRSWRIERDSDGSVQNRNLRSQPAKFLFENVFSRTSSEP